MQIIVNNKIVGINNKVIWNYTNSCSHEVDFQPITDKNKEANGSLSVHCLPANQSLSFPLNPNTFVQHLILKNIRLTCEALDKLIDTDDLI